MTLNLFFNSDSPNLIIKTLNFLFITFFLYKTLILLSIILDIPTEFIENNNSYSL